MEIIKFYNMSFAYPGCNQPALKNINFSVKESEFVVVCGKSGCGKSTMLRHLKKNLMPCGKLEGNVLYKGQEIEELPKRLCASEIGFVQQNPDNQIVTDKVWHELAFGLESLGLDSSAIKRRVAEMASFFGIQTWFRKNINELSGGQKQLLNLASIMVMKPRLLILDEPTSQLDPISASEFISTLKKISSELGTTIIISEHRLEELFPVSDRVLVMDNGELVINDTPQAAIARISAGECKDMFYGLPAVAKIACVSGVNKNYPLTVKDGRMWLANQLGEPEPENTAEAFETASVKSLFKRKTKSNDTPAISMRNVRFRYDKTGTDILRGVNIDIKQGEFFAVLGGNGVGKTTMLKVLTKTVKKDSGTVEINGKNYDKLSDRELFFHGISYLPQNPQALFTETTVYKELMDVFSCDKLPSDEKDTLVCEMLNAMNLEQLRETHPYDLSGGEQQRLALGKLLLLNPKILLLDEPTKGIDPFFKRTLADILKRLCSQGVTILMVTHDIEFSATFADRCAMFFDGEIVSVGEPKEFFAGNSFYTTSANRLANAWFPEAITWEEVAKKCEEILMKKK